MKFEDRSQEETERQERCTRGDVWKLAKNIFKLKVTEKATFYLPSDEWVLPAASTAKPEEREFVVDSGASVHVVSKKDLNSAELETMRISRNPTTVVTANGEVLTKEETTVFVRELDLFVTVMLLEDTPAVLYSENSAKITGIITIGPAVGNHISSKNGRKINCNTAKYVPFVLSTSSSTSSSSTSPSSSSQESVTLTEHPPSTRSDSMSKEVHGNVSHGTAETENPNKNDDNEEGRGNLSHDLPEWLQDFKHGLVELPSGPRAKVVSGTQSIFTQ